MHSKKLTDVNIDAQWDFYVIPFCNNMHHRHQYIGEYRSWQNAVALLRHRASLFLFFTFAYVLVTFLSLFCTVSTSVHMCHT